MPLPGSVHGQASRVLQQPSPVEGMSMAGGLELGGLKCPFQSEPFHGFMKCVCGQNKSQVRSW